MTSTWVSLTLELATSRGSARREAIGRPDRAGAPCRPGQVPGAVPVTGARCRPGHRSTLEATNTRLSGTASAK